jgi:hypothetical protein
MRSFIRCNSDKISCDQIKENKMDAACSTHRSGKKFIQLWLEYPKQRCHLLDLDIEKRI